MSAPDAYLTEGEAIARVLYPSFVVANPVTGSQLARAKREAQRSALVAAKNLLASPEFDALLAVRLTQARAEWLGALVGDSVMEVALDAVITVRDASPRLHDDADSLDVTVAALTAAADLIARTERER